MKCVPHVQHAYFYFFHQSNSVFVALSLLLSPNFVES